jgi:cardiolipin synthase
MGWIADVILVVLLGIFLLALYLHGIFRHKIDYSIQLVPHLDAPSFTALLVGLSNSFPTSANVIGFWSDPDAISKARLAAIRQAQHTIHFETFYMTPGRRANEFAAALSDRALAGVKVQLPIDRFGAIKLSKKYWQQLRQAGVEVRFFHRFDWKDPLEYLERTHRKLLAVDGQVALIGGMGVSDYWDGRKEIGDKAPWLDTEIALTGPIVTALEGTFARYWMYAGGRASLSFQVSKPVAVGSTEVIVTSSDSDAKVSPISTLLWMSILAARERVWIASPYFFLDANCRKALKEAKQKGVDVRVLTVGPRNDKKLVYYAVRERYRDLLKAGIDIYEYQPSMMHAKVMLCDRQWVTLGSANFDPRSFFHNEELNFSLSQSQLAKAVEYFFLCAFANSKAIKWADWKSRSWWQQVLGKLTLFFRWQL